MTKHTTKHRGANNDFDLYGDIEKLKSILADTASHVKDRASGALSNSVDNVREKSAELQGNITDYIAEKPIQSVGIAILSGICLGYWMNSKRKSSNRR